MRMRNLARIATAPEKVGSVFQEIPLDVEVSWIAHRYYIGRRILTDEVEAYLDTLFALQRAVRRCGRVCGYFVSDRYMFGFGGPAYDPKWSVVPDTCPTFNLDVPSAQA